jgi:hypothetical protein
MNRLTVGMAAALLLVAVAPASADEPPAPDTQPAGGAVSTVVVTNTHRLREVLGTAKPGLRILLAPGRYDHLYARKVSGSAEAPIIIEGQDIDDPPVFNEGGNGIHLAGCNYITLRNIKITGRPGNGINIDDGGDIAGGAKGMVVEDVAILKTGPRGNRDGLKLSGLDGFVVRRVTIEGWGGSAVDMVGCRNGVIEDCRFVGVDGFDNGNGVQAKGGSFNVLVQANYFENAGNRAVNIGGSTGLKFFRPKLDDFEARDIEVAGNRFVGGLSPVAFTTSQGGSFHQNTVYKPGRWAIRILQETKDKRFKPSSGGTVANNLFVYDKGMIMFVNDSGGTAPETFTFRNNAWVSLDNPRRRPKLPVAENDPLYQIDPKLSKAGTPQMRITSDDERYSDVGAHSYKRPRLAPQTQPAQK